MIRHIRVKEIQKFGLKEGFDAALKCRVAVVLLMKWYMCHSGKIVYSALHQEQLSADAVVFNGLIVKGTIGNV